MFPEFFASAGIRSGNAEDLQLKPLHAPDDGDKPKRKDHASYKRVDGDLADGERQECQQKRESCSDLRAVAQGVQHHRRGNCQHQQ